MSTLSSCGTPLFSSSTLGGWGHIGCWGDGAMVWRGIYTAVQCTVGRCSGMVHHGARCSGVVHDGARGRWEMMAGEDAALQLPAEESTSEHNLKYRRDSSF